MVCEEGLEVFMEVPGSLEKIKVEEYPGCFGELLVKGPFPPLQYYLGTIVATCRIIVTYVNIIDNNYFSAADHRHSSLHVHHPLSKPPTDSRRKRNNEGRKEGRRGSAPSAATTIEEDQEEEDKGEEESYSQTDGEEGRMTTPSR